MNIKRDNTYCCVPQCRSSGCKNPKLSFHKFPRETEVIKKTLDSGTRVIIHKRDEWRRLLRIGKKVTNRMKVCSKHFSENDYTLPDYYLVQIGASRPRRRLKIAALPSCNLPTTAAENLKEERSGKPPKRKNSYTQPSSLQSKQNGPSYITDSVHWRKSFTHTTDVIERVKDDLIEDSLQESEVSNEQTDDENNPLLDETPEEKEHRSDSEEDSDNNNLLDTIFQTDSLSHPADNCEDVLNRKLQTILGQYQHSRQKMKFYQQKCKLYAKQSMALMEVMDNLKQINSVSNDS